MTVKKNRDCRFTVHLHSSMYNLFKLETTYTQGFVPPCQPAWAWATLPTSAPATPAAPESRREVARSPASKPRSSAPAKPELEESRRRSFQLAFNEFTVLTTFPILRPSQLRKSGCHCETKGTSTPKIIHPVFSC